MLIVGSTSSVGCVKAGTRMRRSLNDVTFLNNGQCNSAEIVHDVPSESDDQFLIWINP